VVAAATVGALGIWLVPRRTEPLDAAAAEAIEAANAD
jgi:hypothetical protein